MTYLRDRDFGLDVSRGLVSGFSGVNKFGAAPSGIQTTPTDIWSRADATPTQQVWLAPTAARVHAIVSDSASDAAAGTGAVSVIIYGLKTWASAETNETVTLTGTTPVNTVESYVIIHRMKCVAQATTTTVGVNAGTITATAATDSTITAVILPGDGQTEMAIYGVPDGYTLYLAAWRAMVDKATATTTCDFELRVNENPDVQTVAFIRKDDISIITAATSAYENDYTKKPKPTFPGPCIIKVVAIASSADIDGKAGFDGYIVAD